ncbi:hypothetical protein QQF64_022696 [Cirrhinus molitorella]|uniref:Uncharacterized protein n=1 Tax=Cirrhinus molitorella TaxID=172907 RepID=A0ABR3L4Q9_9TELE
MEDTLEGTREEASGSEAPAQVTQPWTFSKSSLIRKLRQHLISRSFGASAVFVVIICVTVHLGEMLMTLHLSADDDDEANRASDEPVVVLQPHI